MNPDHLRPGTVILREFESREMALSPAAHALLTTRYPHQLEVVATPQPGLYRVAARQHVGRIGLPGGGLLVGSPQQIIEKLLVIQQTLGNTRYMAQVGLGGLPFAETARSIELLATEIMPAVNRELGASAV